MASASRSSTKPVRVATTKDLAIRDPRPTLPALNNVANQRSGFLRVPIAPTRSMVARPALVAGTRRNDARAVARTFANR
jgi:hypothetical protein